jgi:uncharacterized protein involved in exopolysaccharide biosynthesis
MSFEHSTVMAAGSPPALELQWMFRALWRRRLLAGSILGVVLLLVGVYTAIATPLYEATALLLVKIGREYVYQAEVGEGTGQIMPRSRETLINSEIQILRSAEVVKAVVEEIGVEALYPSLALNAQPGQPIESMAAARFLDNLRVRAVEDADVIQVSLTNTDPQVTARAVNLLVERFKEAHLQAFGEGQTLIFLEEQTAQASEELKLAETGLLEFQAQHPQFSLENKDQLLLAEHTQLETALRDVENQIVGARQRSLTSGPPVPSAQEQLLQLQLQERKLLNTHNEDSRQVQNVRREISLVQEFLADEAKNHSGKHGEEIAILSARKKALEERLAAIEGDLGSLPALSARYRELQRKVDATESRYKKSTSRLENARSSAEMDRQKIANISVIQPAYAPLQPVSPRPLLNLLVALIIGGGLAVGAALGIERLSPSM